jgi:hypothetical protein
MAIWDHARAETKLASNWTAQTLNDKGYEDCFPREVALYLPFSNKSPAACTSLDFRIFDPPRIRPPD